MRKLVFALIILIAVAILFSLGWSRIPDVLASNLSKKLGVATSIDSIRLRPSRIDVNKVTIGNAKGYSLPKAFSAEEIELKASLSRYFHKTVVVDEVDVNDIYLGLEFDSSSTVNGNWTQILSHYQEAADLDEKDGRKVTIKRLICNNIRTELMFRNEGKGRKLPLIKQIVLTDITTEGGFPIDQLMSSILGQMLKQVFLEQNLGNMIKGLLDTPGKAVDIFLKPFKEIFNANPSERSSKNDCV